MYRLNRSKEAEKLFLNLVLDLKEMHHLNQTGIPRLCDGILELTYHFLDNLVESLQLENTSVEEKIKSTGQELLLNFPPVKLCSEYQIMKILEEEYGFIPPVQVHLGTEYIEDVTGLGEMIEQEVSAMVVPFKKSLEQLFHNLEIRDYLLAPKVQSNNNKIKSVWDGTLCKDHPIVAKYEQCLLVQMYEDDIELTNPLGAYTKTHKICNVYWNLLNLPEHVRSNLKSMSLLGISKSTKIKQFGFESLLEDFFEGVQELQSSEGMEMSVDGELMKIHGALISLSGDGLAMNGIGGFKESFSFATRPCRICYETQDQISSVFYERNLRTLEKYEEEIQKLNNAATLLERNRLSIEFGLTGESVMTKVENFDVTKMLHQDFMHNMYEGCSELEARNLLRKMVIEDKVLSLECLNNRIQTFPYPHEQIKNKPSKIELAHLDNKLRLNASQIMCLKMVLPFVLASYCDEKNSAYLQNFTLLCQIASRLMAFEFCRESLPELRFMIQLHHLRFVHLYPDVKPIPKFHFIVHAPSTLEMLGPLRNSWTMRYEARNNWFCKSAHATNCFKNIEKSLAKQFQIKRCVDLELGDQNAIILGDKTFAPTFSSKIDLNTYKLGPQVAREFNLKTCSQIIDAASSIFLNNFLITQDSVLLCKDDDSDLPLFGKVAAIFVKEASCVFLVRLLVTSQFDALRNAYGVKETDNFQCFCSSRLPTLQTFPLIKYTGKLYIVLSFYDRSDFCS